MFLAWILVIVMMAYVGYTIYLLYDLAFGNNDKKEKESTEK